MTVPHLAEEKLTRMVDVALSHPQTKPTAKILPFTRPLPYVGGLATAAAVLVAILWQPTPENNANNIQLDPFMMEYTMLEVLEGGI